MKLYQKSQIEIWTSAWTIRVCRGKSRLYLLVLDYQWIISCSPAKTPVLLWFLRMAVGGDGKARRLWGRRAKQIVSKAG